MFHIAGAVPDEVSDAVLTRMTESSLIDESFVACETSLTFDNEFEAENIFPSLRLHVDIST